MSRAMLLVAALLATAIVGCGKSSKSTEPSTGPGSIEDFQALVSNSFPEDLSIPPGVSTSSHMLITMQYGSVRFAGALFQLAGTFVDAGTVRAAALQPGPMGGVDTLARRSVPVRGTPFYVYSTLPHLPDMPDLAFDGAHFNRFEVTGSAAVPAFSDSVLSVVLPALSAPAQGASVARSNDLVIGWSDAGSDTSVYMLCSVHSEVDTTRYVLATLVRDMDGTTSVPAARLGSLAAGAARLLATRVRLVHRSHGSFTVDLICEASSVRSLTLQ